MMRYLFSFIFVPVLLLFAVPARAQFVNRVRVTDAVPATATLQSGATANGNGTAMDVSGHQTVSFVVTGTGVWTVNFEVTGDDSRWETLSTIALEDLTIKVSASAAGTFVARVGALKTVRARVSGYSSGAVTVTARATVVAGTTIQPVTDNFVLQQLEGVSNQQVNGDQQTQIVGPLPLPAGAATGAKQDTGNTSLSNLEGDLGDTADAEATVNGSAIAILKRLRTLLAGGFPAALSAGGGVKVGLVDAIPAGTNNIGDVDVLSFPDNEPINVSQINGVTPLMGAGNTGTGSPRVTIASDQAALPGMGVGATGSAVPPNANYIAGIGSGNTAGIVNCDSQAFLNMTTATTTELVALTSSQTIRVCHVRVISNGTTTVTFKRGTGTNCGTGTAAIDADYQLTAQTGFAAGTGIGEVLNGGAASNALCVTSSQAVNLAVFVRYTKY